MGWEGRGGEGRGGEGQYSYEYCSRPRFTHGTVQYAGREEDICSRIPTSKRDCNDSFFIILMMLGTARNVEIISYSTGIGR